jgi:hypothetical protein
MRIFESRSNAVVFTFFALTAFSCANGATTPYNQLTTSSSTESLAGGTTSPTVQGDYTCPLDPNVVAVNDPNLDGTDEYKVCKDTSAPSQILIHGETETSDQICVIPALSTATGVVAYTSQTIQCPMIVAGGVNVSYPGLTYNAVYIVEAGASAQLLTCLQTGYNCPSTYSYGVFQ